MRWVKNIQSHLDATWQKKAAEAEAALLRRYVKTPIVSQLVEVGDGDFINTIALNIGRSDKIKVSSERRTIVLTHGYGSGLGFWFNNLDHLAQLRDPVTKQPFQILCLDWLGMARSSRPPFLVKCHRILPKNSIENMVERHERYFLDSLEIWRGTVGLHEPFILGGHSLGGYLSSAYTLQHGKPNISALILISPFGLPPVPTALEETKSFDTSEHLSWSQARKVPLSLRLMLSAWRNDFTPQLILRGMAGYGPRFTRNIVDRRFGDRLSAEEKDLIASYLYHITMGPPAGEYALNGLMKVVMRLDEPRQVGDARERRRSMREGGIFARRPIGQRLFEGLSSNVPVHMYFGDNDWMFQTDLLQLPLLKSGRASLDIISAAGHHLYLDNSREFNNKLGEFILKL